ncbi:hypothetical protein [Chryseobacterium bernardetii]|uniref:hypothetical protein n=1 Tax=Chryseobacterium bernardetii TaxID=1241978 RepID=UPI00162A14DF|nr:hypothetical protein [Chryseobacterium bernardetii]
MKKILFAAILAVSLLSCTENKPHPKPVIENAVDNAESSFSSIAKSDYSRGGNLVNTIYAELLKNNKNLQSLDKRIADVSKETNIVINEYSIVIDKSENYYHDAKNLSGSITDSIAKNQIEKEIQNSADKYNLKNQAIRDLIKKTKANQSTIYEQYTIFKIRKTLPEIEKYQNAHPLKTDSLDNFINKQNQLLNELKNIK